MPGWRGFLIVCRMLVAIAFPGAWIGTRLDNSVWFFVRGGRGQDLEPYPASLTL
ncbi:MAG: hypothetical protein P4M11_06810 [Candidatus Pacebacteria bacterium]|nr:hypothetical protein [Candidatus Paceibacterota bacterium]